MSLYWNEGRLQTAPHTTFVRKPPVVKAYQFTDERDCEAQQQAEQYGRCYFYRKYQYQPQNQYGFEHDDNMDWIDSKIFHDGTLIERSHKEVRIDVGWWIVIDEVEDTVEFLPNHKFRHRYQEA